CLGFARRVSSGFDGLQRKPSLGHQRHAGYSRSASSHALCFSEEPPTPPPPPHPGPTAARTIQEAVDAAAIPGALLLVSNGVYSTGGRILTGSLSNRVAAHKPLELRSVNGPGFTTIEGFQMPDSTKGDAAVRCVYLTNDASLSGFTLINGATRTEGDWAREQSGGGVWCEPGARVDDCVIFLNSAAKSGGRT